MVINLDRVNIAITHNYVSRSNLGDVLRFLKYKENQISGCRDREESVKPNKLYAAFSSGLQDTFGKDADWLVQAQRQGGSHWTCDAWKDNELNGAHMAAAASMKRKLEATDEKQARQENSDKGSSIMSKAKIGNTIESGDAPFSFSFL